MISATIVAISAHGMPLWVKILATIAVLAAGAAYIWSITSDYKNRIR